MPTRSRAAALAVSTMLLLAGCGDDDADPPQSPRGAEDPTLEDGDSGVDLEGGESDSGSESDVEPRTGEGGVPTTSP